ncbi:MAG: hypothetical protein V3V92_02580 [Candidatus Hydrothermarchaeales archaeon]
MITAQTSIGTLRIDHLVNRGQWFGETWLIGIGCGFSTFTLVVEADCEQDAIDELVDSKYGHLLKTDKFCEACAEDDWDHCGCAFAGNYEDRVNLDEVRILERVKVNYFAKPELFT